MDLHREFQDIHAEINETLSQFKKRKEKEKERDCIRFMKSCQNYLALVQSELDPIIFSKNKGFLFFTVTWPCVVGRSVTCFIGQAQILSLDPSSQQQAQPSFLGA